MDTLIRKDDSRLIIAGRMGDLDLSSPFFDSFIESYGNPYREWFERKRNDKVWLFNESDRLRGLLKLKLEDETEDYTDITPIFIPKRRLKICSLKVEPNDAEISRVFMETALREASRCRVSDIYATLAANSSYKSKLVRYLEKWGFRVVGTKYSNSVVEDVFALQLDTL